MSVVPSVLFLFAAAAAIAAIWTSLRLGLPAISALKHELAAASQDRMIHVSTLQTRDDVAKPMHRPARARRHARPKPVTHRLHHFPHAA